MVESVLLFNKPYGVLSQFTDASERPTLADYIDAPGYYPAGRLDKDSEGLLLLTRDGRLQQKISNPKHKLSKVYLVQVEGEISQDAMEQLMTGVTLKDGAARAFNVERQTQAVDLWKRDPPVRFRRHIPTSWISMTLREGRNRQVRRMTAAVGFPTLRLVRTQIGQFDVWDLLPGEHRREPA